MEKCGKCYWYRWVDSVWGNCWRFPPVILINKSFLKIEYGQERPEIFADDFACGEFKLSKIKENYGRKD